MFNPFIEHVSEGHGVPGEAVSVGRGGEGEGLSAWGGGGVTQVLNGS